MADIDDKEATLLVAFIYRPELQSECDNLMVDGESHTVSDLIAVVEDFMEIQTNKNRFGAEMTKSEFQDVLNEIKASETLMSLEIVNIETNEQTYFRAMTLKPQTQPEGSQDEINPIIVYRGTAGNYQWDDNLAATVTSLTPSVREAQQYAIKSGYDHLTIVGHSKGGNMAASMAYLLPEGMVDKVYSIDGQGVSEVFLSNIELTKQEYAKKSVFNVNEYRDIVSQLLTKTGINKNTTFVDSGIRYKDTGYDDIKMRLFHAHKPNYFTTDGARYISHAYTPALVGQISKFIDVNGMEKHQAIVILMATSSALHGNEEIETAWDYRMWSAVYDAEKVYNKTNSARKSAIMHKLSELYDIKFSNYDLVQEKDSFVVEGAVLTCPYCNGIGSLEQVENRTALEQGKPKAASTDSIPWDNICMENLECSLRRYEYGDLAIKCSLDLNDKWILTDSSITVDINGSGKEVDAVLKKSILGCFNGGWIEVVHNGQLQSGDYQKKKLLTNINQKVADTDKKLKNVKKTIENLPGKVVDDTAIGITSTYHDMRQQATDLWEGFVNDLINKAIKQHYR